MKRIEFLDALRGIAVIMVILFHAFARWSKIVPYHNNSDSMTDYFDYAYYYRFSIGKWDKPYVQK